MRTPRRRRPTDADLAELRTCHRTLSRIMASLHPATPEYRATGQAFDAVRTCAIDWTGNPTIWTSADSDPNRGRLLDTFVKRPDQAGWPG